MTNVPELHAYMLRAQELDMMCEFNHILFLSDGGEVFEQLEKVGIMPTTSYEQSLLDAVGVLHGNQRYGEHPYTYHIKSVMDKVHALGYGDLIHITVAAYHDALEDTALTYDELCKIHGNVIAEAVYALTKRLGLPYRDYIEQVRNNSWALRVKMADTICNLEESIRSNDTERIQKYSKQLHLLVEKGDD